ncbi:hypothetical protein NBG98_31730, partial [Burkholderia cenocepacia]|uniref:hypothetical protein n=1 Tax=Burkholderia cenocepacia TaxID=95486 RepID=UPI00203E5308
SANRVVRDAGRRALVAPRRRDNIVVSHPITTTSEAKQGRLMSGNRHVGIPFACRPVSGKRFAKKARKQRMRFLDSRQKPLMAAVIGVCTK